MIHAARVISHRLLTDHIFFRLLINRDGQEEEVFAKSYILASTAEKTDIVLGMTRKRLALMGLDMDTCTDEEWAQFITNETYLGGQPCEVEEKDNPPYGVQYDILTNAVASVDRAAQILQALRNIKGRPRAAAVPPPAAPVAAPAPAPAPARPTMSAPARPVAPKPLAAPVGARPSPI